MRLSRTASGVASTSTFRVAVALLCVLLILLVGATQVLHQHGLNEVQNPNCSLCAVVHLTAVVAPVVDVARAEEAVQVARVLATRTAAARAVSFALYVRPPPVSTR